MEAEAFNVTSAQKREKLRWLVTKTEKLLKLWRLEMIETLRISWEFKVEFAFFLDLKMANFDFKVKNTKYIVKLLNIYN